MSSQSTALALVEFPTPRKASKTTEPPKLAKYFYLRGDIVYYRRKDLHLNESTGYTVKDLALAYAEGVKLAAAARAGTPSGKDRGTLTVRDFYNEHFPTAEARQTQKAKCVVIFVEQYGPRKLNKVTMGDLKEYKAARLSATSRSRRQFKASTIRTELIYLHAFFKRAVDKGYLAHNPFRNATDSTDKVSLPPKGVKDRILDDPDESDEQARFLDALRDDETRDAVRFILGSGVRFEEFSKISPFDIRTGTLWITDQIGKYGKGREVALQPATLALVKRQALRRGIALTSHAPLFTLTNDELGGRMTRACLDAVIRQVTPHDLRRTYGSRMAFCTPNPKVLMNLMGHTSLEVTLQHYIKVNRKRMALIVSEAKLFL